MSFFPRAFVSDPSSSFTPLFRLLDEYGDYQSSHRSPQHHRNGAATRTFAPKFDVKEVADAYELHGELPGIEQKDVDIEFTDYATLTVRGKSERSYTAGTPPPGLIEPIAAAATQPALKNGAPNDHHATVEDEPEPGTPTTSASTSTSPSQQVVKHFAKTSKEPEGKYWISERSVGEFARSFSFPERVDQDQVRASMKNGILSVIVPKAKKQDKRKITIA